MKLWGGRFTKESSKLVEEFNASIQFDQCLAEYDIQGSLAHVKMLGSCNILSESTVNTITKGLLQIHTELNEGKLTFHIRDEDIHLNIERKLYELIGDDAGALHTGRSRNDQVSLDLHLYLRDQILQIGDYISILCKVIVTLAEKYNDVMMPGYTHLQRAEPIRFSHHLMAYFNMFTRDFQRLKDSFKRINVSPLGAGALAGSGFAVDREYVAELLNFEGVYDNSLDAVSDRDFIAEFLFNASLIMMHFSKLCEEIILWCSQEFSFIQLDEQYCTGSSMMPQKKNPDIAELTRGKTGRVYGSLIAILTVLKGLPLAYNKDLQEDKEGLFDTVNTLKNTLAIFIPMLETIQVNSENMYHAASNDYSNATQLANYLVSKGIPFRQAHFFTGKIVICAIDKNCLIQELELTDLQAICPQIELDVYSILGIEQVVEAHLATGGTAKKSVSAQIKNAKVQVNNMKDWISAKNELLKYSFISSL